MYKINFILTYLSNIFPNVFFSGFLSVISHGSTYLIG